MDHGQKNDPNTKNNNNKNKTAVKTSEKHNRWLIVEQKFQHSPFRSTCSTVVGEGNNSNAWNSLLRDIVSCAAQYYITPPTGSFKEMFHFFATFNVFVQQTQNND